MKIDHTEITVRLMNEDFTAKYLQENAELIQATIEATTKALSMPRVSEWVAVSEREPKIEKEYLVYTVWKSIHIAEWYDETFIIDGGALSINSDITHWKEIEPPIL